MQSEGSTDQFRVAAGRGNASVVFVLASTSRAPRSLATRIRELGWRVCSFESSIDFLSSPPLPLPSCLVLDAEASAGDLPALQERVAMVREPLIYPGGPRWPCSPPAAMMRA